jgi:glycerol kinase
MVFDLHGKVIASHSKEFEQIYPKPGWAEHNPIAILDSCHECINVVVQKMIDLGHNPQNIKSMGITNQRETTVVW